MLGLGLGVLPNPNPNPNPNLYLGVPLPPGEAALCPLAGVYSRAKLAQVLFSQELQHRASRHRANAKPTDEEAGDGRAPRAVAAFSLHPGTVRSGIVTLPAWLVRPTDIGARVLLYCLLNEDAAPGRLGLGLELGLDSPNPNHNPNPNPYPIPNPNSNPNPNLNPDQLRRRDAISARPAARDSAPS